MTSEPPTPAVPLSTPISFAGSSAYGASAARTPGSNATSQTNSFQSFGDYSQFLRESVADEESLQMGESLQQMAVQIEALMEQWRTQPAGGSWLAQAFMDLLDTLRSHRTMLVELGEDWHRFYEFRAHLAAVNQFRSQLATWAQQSTHGQVPQPQPSDFDLSAWRLLGAGALLLDVYEQSSKRQKRRTSKPGSVWGRLVGWIKK